MVVAIRAILIWFCIGAATYYAVGVHDVMAAIDLNDGATHTISGSSAQVLLSNGTSLIVTSGASIVSGSTEAGIAAYDYSGYNVTISGGSVTGGSNSQSSGGVAGGGIEMNGGTLNISGGTFTGGNASFLPGAGLSSIDTDVTISDGTFIGGQNSINSIISGNGLQTGGGNYEISGGTFEGADGYEGGTGAALGWYHPVYSTSSYALITGGSFSAGTPGFGQPGYSLAVGYNYPWTVDLKGGHFNGKIVVAAGDSTLNIYGQGLTATPITQGEHVSGTLLDGSSLSVDIEVYDPGVVNLISVPEPTSLVLAALGVGLVLCKTTRRIRGWQN